LRFATRLCDLWWQDPIFACTAHILAVDWWTWLDTILRTDRRFTTGCCNILRERIALIAAVHVAAIHRFHSIFQACGGFTTCSQRFVRRCPTEGATVDNLTIHDRLFVLFVLTLHRHVAPVKQKRHHRCCGCRLNFGHNTRRTRRPPGGHSGNSMIAVGVLPNSPARGRCHALGSTTA